MCYNYFMIGKRVITLILFLLFISSAVFSSDLIILKDGSVLVGDILSYEEDGAIKFQKQDGTSSLYDISSIASFKTQVDVDKEIQQKSTTSYNLIQYYPRTFKGNFLPQRYVYKGKVFNLESQWEYIKTKQVLAFYDALDKTNLDRNTEILMETLLKEVKHFNTVKISSLIMFGIGFPLLFMPYITSNDSDPENITFPDWAGYAGFAGITITCASVGMTISQAEIDIDSLVEGIATSYNKNYLSQ